MENNEVTISYLLNVMNERLNRQERLLGGIYEYTVSVGKAAEKKKYEEVAGYYGPLYSFSQDPNVFIEDIHRKPSISDVTSISVAMRLVGNQDFIAVINDMGASYFTGCWAGKNAAEIDYKGLSSNKDVINSIVELRYGPAVELTDLVLEDRDILRRAGREIENYSVELENYGPEPVVNIDENGEMNFNFYSQPEADGNSSARISYENSSYEDNLIQNLEIPTTELSEVGEISYG